MQTASEIAGWI